jgi:Mn2+/Fe2+ NRAMP family transporter
MYLDAWVSMIVFTAATVSFYFLGATVLHRQKLDPKGPAMIASLSEMYVPTFGDWTRFAFLIGAWAVLFKTLYVASASHGRLTTDFLSLGRFIRFDSAGERSVWVRRFCILYPIVGLGLYFAFRDPKAMVTFGGFAQAITLPVISAATIYLRYRRTDGRLAPSWLSDLFLWTALIGITLVAGKSVWDTIVMPLWKYVS